MKRTISVVLVAVMLFSMMAIVPMSSAVTVDAKNVGIEAYYFGGQVDYRPAKGSATTNPPKYFLGTTQTVKAGDASKGVLTLDGTITEEEWGQPTLVLDSHYAADNAGRAEYKNKLFETVSAENTFLYYRTLNQSGTKIEFDTELGMNLTAYYMWDEDYLYVAAKVIDYNGHKNGKSGIDAWNGDALQLRVDSEGPNSIVGGEAYDPTVTPFPWSGSERNDYGQEYYARVPNFVFAYTSAGGGATVCWDASPRYQVAANPDKDNRLEGQQADISPLMEKDEYGWGKAYATVHPVKDEALSAETGGKVFVTDYEIAIPWTYVYSTKDPVVQAGAELGLSMGLLNIPSNGTEYNSYIEWGTGIFNERCIYNPQTCGGSNSLTLVGTPNSERVACTHNFAAATCTEPETCTACGYQRGYAAGHKFAYSNQKLPTTDTAGHITSTCTVPGCDYSFVTEIPATNTDVYGHFYKSDSSIQDKGLSVGYESQWKDGETALWNKDGTAKNTYWGVGAERPTDGMVNPFDFAVADMSQYKYIGNYYEASSVSSQGFTYKMDLNILDVLDYTNADTREDSIYPANFHFWFGGESNGYNGTAYAAGFFATSDNEYYFAILQNEYLGKDISSALLEEKALSFKKIDLAYLNMNNWNELVFMYDKTNAAAFLYWNDELVASAADYHMADPRSEINPLFRKFNVPAYAADIEIGNLALASTYIPTSVDPTPATYTLTVDGVAKTYSEGETVELSAPAKKLSDDASKGYMFDKWIVENDAVVPAEIEANVTTIVMPASDVVINSKYYMYGDIDNNGKINTMDIFSLKLMLKGTREPTKYANLVGADLKINTMDNFRFKLIYKGMYDLQNWYNA